MTAAAAVGYCLVAFGIGFSGGALQRMFRQAVEAVD